MNYETVRAYIPTHALFRLNGCGIYTIGDLAQTKAVYLESICAKAGVMLHDFANGWDTTPVARIEDIS